MGEEEQMGFHPICGCQRNSGGFWNCPIQWGMRRHMYTKQLLHTVQYWLVLQTFLLLFFFFFKFSVPYLLRCGPYVSSMSVLDSSRFHWQCCRSSSHSDLDRRPRRNNCSTYNTDGEKRHFRQEGIFELILFYFNMYF